MHAGTDGGDRSGRDGTPPEAADETDGAARARAVEMTGKVKFYSRAKSLGFLYFDDGSADALLHASVLSRSGRDYLDDETTVSALVETEGGRRRVAEILDVDVGTACMASARDRTLAGQKSTRCRLLRVKLWDEARGFGFFEQPAGADVYVNASVVQEAGRSSLEAGEEWIVDVHAGERGLAAWSIAKREVAGCRLVTHALRVKSWDEARGFGFFEQPSGADVFVHASVVREVGRSSLEAGEEWVVDVYLGNKGLAAGSIRPPGSG